MAAKTVYVELVAQTKKFNQGMQKAEKRLGRSKKAVAALSGAMLAVGAVAARKLVNELSLISVELDSVAKTARGLGVEFSFLEDVQFVAKRLGSDAGLGTIQKTMLAVAKNASYASQGLETYTREFEALGINVEEFLKLDQTEQLLSLRDAFAQGAKGPRELAALTVLAGRGAKSMLNFFEAGREEFEGLIKERRALGGFTAEAGKLAEEMEDVKVNIEQVKRGLKDAVFRTFGPTLLEWYKGTQKFVIALRDAGLTVPIMKGLVAVIGVGMVSAMTALTAVTVTWVAAMAPVAFTVGAVAAGITGLAAGIYTLVTRWDELTESVRWFLDNVTKLDGITNFGGEVLRFLGFGDDGAAANRAAAPAPVPAGLSSGNSTTNNSSTTNNYYVTGNSTVEKSLREREAAQRRGKGR